MLIDEPDESAEPTPIYREQVGGAVHVTSRWRLNNLLLTS
jgi:hypothetical protein